MNRDLLNQVIVYALVIAICVVAALAIVSAGSAAKPRTMSAEYDAQFEGHRVGSQAWQYRWQVWLPDKWQRIGACETGYGKRPGRWDWNSGTYQGAFGFHHQSWDQFKPVWWWPKNAYDATPWQQYRTALAIHARYGFSGWGCRNA